MPKSATRIAVIGAGLIGRKHVDVVAAYAQLDAIVDPDPTTEALAAEKGTRWFSDLDDYLANHRPDGAIIATPNRLHLSNGTACLNKGVPVLMEKPLAEGAEEGRQLVTLSNRTGTAILVGHHRRHSSLVKAAKATIESGRLGCVVAVNGMFWLNKPSDYFDATWRTVAGGGPTYINMIHDIDLLQHFCGPIVRVQAREANTARGFEVEDTSAVILEFASGALGTVSICDTASAPWSWELTSGENPIYPKTDQSCYTFGGTLGSLSVPDLRVWSHDGAQSWWSPIKADQIDVAPEDPIKGQFQHFLDVIAGTAAPLVTATDGLRNIEVLDAIKRAAAKGDVQTVGTPET